MEVRKGKLNILEPWEYGTDVSLEVELIGKKEGQYLVSMSKPILIKQNEIWCFLAEHRDKKLQVNLMSNETKGAFPLAMVYSKEITKNNFTDFNIDNFRGNFLLGEIVLK